MHSELLNTILTEIYPGQSFQTEPDESQFTSDVVPRRILLAEDGTINQLVAIGFLERRGHQVMVVGDGQLALDAIEREDFDAVLMDVQMPHLDGFAATAAIRRREVGTGRHLPIIAMTANAMKGDRERCLEAGMDDYVPKPIEPESLFRAVESFPATVLASRSIQADAGVAAPLVSQSAGTAEDSVEQTKSRSSTVKASPSEPDSTHETDATSQLIDWGVVMKRIPGGNDVARELAGMLLIEAPKYVEQIREALQSGDAAVLRRAAHTLKGSAAIFEIKSLVVLSQAMEAHAKAEDFKSASGLLEELAQAVSRVLVELTVFVEAK